MARRETGRYVGRVDRFWIFLGGIAGAAAVTMAAYTAHGLPTTMPAAAERQIASALRMHEMHALALLAVGLWAPRGGRLAHAAGCAFALGLLLFCGTVYALGFGAAHLPVLAPVGGTLLILGWLLLAGSAYPRRRSG
jgi:uncharacterized membrane protein YgdD (TMEM256/DUF423 family)